MSKLEKQVKFKQDEDFPPYELRRREWDSNHFELCHGEKGIDSRQLLENARNYFQMRYPNDDFSKPFDEVLDRFARKGNRMARELLDELKVREMEDADMERHLAGLKDLDRNIRSKDIQTELREGIKRETPDLDPRKEFDISKAEVKFNPFGRGGYTLKQVFKEPLTVNELDDEENHEGNPSNPDSTLRKVVHRPHRDFSSKPLEVDAMDELRIAAMELLSRKENVRRMALEVLASLKGYGDEE